VPRRQSLDIAHPTAPPGRTIRANVRALRDWGSRQAHPAEAVAPIPKPRCAHPICSQISEGRSEPAAQDLAVGAGRGGAGRAGWQPFLTGPLIVIIAVGVTFPLLR